MMQLNEGKRVSLAQRAMMECDPGATDEEFKSTCIRFLELNHADAVDYAELNDRLLGNK